MNIRIESLSVNGLGPIASIKWQLKNVNLIYGKNEQGKTFLVEYLLRSLFKNTQSTRELTDSGQVNISGLENEITSFKPKSKKKIEDYVFLGEGEKSVDLSRLCVVKGGELSFLPNERKSITKDVLKEYLSDQRILDAIMEPIPANIRESSWENGQIISGRRAGKISEWNASNQQLEEIDGCLRDVDESFMLGELKKLRSEMTVVENTVKDQRLACRAYAHRTAELIKDKEKELEKIPQEMLDGVKSLKTKIETKNGDIDKNQEKIKNLGTECENFPWLEKAIEEYDKRPAALAGKLGIVFVILAILGIVVSTTCAFLKLPIITLVFGMLSVLFVILFAIQYRSKLRGMRDDVEVERIFQEFEEKFGEKAHSIAALRSKDEYLKEKYYGLKELKGQIEEYRVDLSESNNLLKSNLAQLGFTDIITDEYAYIIDSLEKKHRQLTSEISELREKLAETHIKEDEYIKEKIKILYDPEILQKNLDRKQVLADMINDTQKKLDVLKQRVCGITKDPISSEWDELINHLRNRRDEACQASKDLKALIGSGIIITNTISNIRDQEDRSITRALASHGLSEPIQAITHNYDGVELDRNDLIAYNLTQRYPVSNLSTGAQEQVLLALRIGIASYVLLEQKMFLILDDAFQHSDWERREWLVDEMLDLSRIGWQIIYFSMDDHIKQLFEERIKPKLKNQYQTFNLEP